MPLKCKCWGCTYCAPDRVKDLKGLARRGHPNRFLTLTVNPEWGGSPEERAQRLVVAWRYIRQQAKRELGIDKIHFLAVFERTKNGEPHLHILLRAKWLQQKWLSDKMRRYMEAPVIDIRRVKSKRRAAWYVAKYVAEETARWEGCKRYWRDQSWEVPEEVEKRNAALIPGSWEMREIGLTFWCDQHERWGWKVERKRDRAYATAPPGWAERHRAC